MQNLIDQLHDIDGLKSISRWPLAIGFKILIVLGVLVLIGLLILLYRWIKFNRSWKKETLLRLAELDKNLAHETSRETLIELSTYLRRIALKRFSRKECAGLVGKGWLDWLTANDMAKFNWKEKGKVLIDAPYSPLNATIEVTHVKELIQATRGWVK